MPQPILTKYKQGDLGMPYPKNKNKNNLNLSAHGGEADPEVATKDYPSKPNSHVQSSFWKKANEKDYQEEIMSEIMKKIKHAEMSSVADKTPARGKLDGSIMKKYSHGEFSGAGGKAPKEKLEAFASARIKQGSHNS